MYRLFWFFFIYTFLGWCTEVCYVTLLKGKFVNRGFLNGPACPIYGFGALIVLICLTPLKGSKPLLFLGSMILTSLLELLTGFVLEKIFHQRWWDYTDEPFNIGGYICLRFSVGWGLACMFVVYLLHPTVLLFIRLIPHSIGLALLTALSFLMIVDLIATVRTITRLNRRLSQIDELAARIKDVSNDIGENLADRVLDAAERGSDLKEELEERTEQWKDRADGLKEDLETLKDGLSLRREAIQDGLEERMEQRIQRRQLRYAQRQVELEQLRARLDELLDGQIFGQERLMRAFPKMRSQNHPQALERLRQYRNSKKRFD